MPQEVTRARLRQLANVKPQRGRVLSVFLNLDPAEFATADAKKTAISSVMSDAREQVGGVEGLDHDEREDLKADLELVRDTLERDDLADDGAHGVAVFASTAGDLLELVRLSYPVDTRVVIDRNAFLEPLVQEGDERWVVLLANRNTARIFQGTPENLEETDRVDDNVHQQTRAGEGHYDAPIGKEVQDHLGHVGEVMFTLHKRRPIDHLLVGGPEETLGDVEEALHPYVREKLAGRVKLDVQNAGIDEVRTAAAEAAEEHLTKREREVLDRLQQGLGRGERAAAGIDDVLAALNEFRVEILLIADGAAASGFVDTSSGMLTGPSQAGEVVDEGALEPVEDIVEEAVQKAIEQSATVMIVRRHDDLDQHGGIAAVLRF